MGKERKVKKEITYTLVMANRFRVTGPSTEILLLTTFKPKFFSASICIHRSTTVNSVLREYILVWNNSRMTFMSILLDLKHIDVIIWNSVAKSQYPKIQEESIKIALISAYFTEYPPSIVHNSLHRVTV